MFRHCEEELYIDDAAISIDNGIASLLRASQ